MKKAAYDAQRVASTICGAGLAGLRAVETEDRPDAPSMTASQNVQVILELLRRQEHALSHIRERISGPYPVAGNEALAKATGEPPLFQLLSAAIRLAEQNACFAENLAGQI
jgi:hypothetical protein